MLQEALIHRGGLDHAAVGGEVALEHRERAFAVDRIVEGADDVVVEDLGTLDVLAEAFAGHGEAAEVQMLADVLHQRADAAGVVEILHQVLVAAGPHVADHRYAPAVPFEIIQSDILAGSARHRDQMDDGVG